MKDEQTITLVESINLNPNLDACDKLDLIKKTMSDCREKQVGKILIEAIEKKTKKIQEDQVPKKRGRGRPKKTETVERERSENELKMIEAAKNGDATKE